MNCHKIILHTSIPYASHSIAKTLNAEFQPANFAPFKLEVNHLPESLLIFSIETL